ncbi:hypothetical protein FHR84_000391 [Actinopolyspora biskrensis]|uniref:PEP-CTERM protein-sorting domain-containing protein n=1 Tax=Actinopolyspora biskrensis TaxID=1470178 RepID=A0A852Z422_9ACTN|nr:hypothetical protein [Actinopolyspora biskrensis]NYH77077.1 hypothetical protein [Actinopolyspora biskrensis]
MSQHRRRSTIARRISFVGACVCMLLAMLTSRLAVADGFTGQFPWAGHWVTSVALGAVSFALGFFYFGRRSGDTE